MSSSEISSSSESSNVGSTSTTSSTTATSPKGSVPVTSDTKVGSLATLRETSPETYNAICNGIAQMVCTKMKEDQDRLEEQQKEYERH